LMTGLANVAIAAPGDLDLSFDQDGWLSTEPPGSQGSVANSVLVQPDQKIVAGGLSLINGEGNNFCLARYLPNGSPDDSFGNHGIVLTDFPESAGNHPVDFILSLALQDDGKIVAGGGTVLGSNLPISQTPPSAGDMNFALARYLPNGALD